MEAKNEYSGADWQLSRDADVYDDPLLDCLMQVTKLMGCPTTRTSLRSGLPLTENRLTVELFPRAANRADLSARVVKRKLENISNLELPAILLLDSGNACVLVDVDKAGEKLKILLPETEMGSRDVGYAELQELYTGYSIFVRPKYKPDQKVVSELDERSGNWFWSTLFTSWRIYRDVIIASLMINIFGLATPFFVLNVYDRVVPNNAFETLWVLATGMIVISLFELIMRGLRGYFIDVAGKKAELKLSATLFEKVMGLRMEVRPKSVGAFSKNLQEFDSVRNFITSLSISTLVDLPFVLLGLMALWYIGGSIVWIMVTAIILILLYALLIQIPLKNAVKKTFSASAEKSSIIIEGLSGIETIRTLGGESQIQRSLENSVSHIANWGTVSRLLSSSVSHVSNFIKNLAVIGVVVMGVYLIADGNLTHGGLIACVILSRRTIMPMSQVTSLATKYHRAKTALTTLNNIMELPEERPRGKAFLHRASISGEVELRDVSFRYPGAAHDSLKNISLKIQPGEHVGIIGATGSGKSTLARLIMGLYEPTEGMVGIDGTDIRQIDIAELRQFIGYVPQDIMLFNGSVRDNIVFGTHDVSDETILDVAEISGVARFVKRHESGFDLQVGERGRQLSGGQRQSVAVARALVLDPKILLMDEPTNSMDNRTESRLIRRLKPMAEGKTMILISHKMSSLSLVDRVVVLEKGVIVADGPKEQVMQALETGKLSTND